MQTEEIKIDSVSVENVNNTETFVNNKTFYCYFKRCMDVVCSVLGLIILAIPLLIVGLVILIDSPGASPIYVQKRIGKNGREFDFYKFRSMVANADKLLDSLLEKNEMDGPVFKIKDDPRITRFGRFIRKTGIDELPQLWNVLKGDMSLVGPRPPLPREVENYNKHHYKRLSVTPGITCYWQVQPQRNSISFEDWVDFDLKYIKDRSLKTDIIILFKTIGAIFGAEGE